MDLNDSLRGKKEKLPHLRKPDHKNASSLQNFSMGNKLPDGENQRLGPFRDWGHLYVPTLLLPLVFCLRGRMVLWGNVLFPYHEKINNSKAT